MLKYFRLDEKLKIGDEVISQKKRNNYKENNDLEEIFEKHRNELFPNIPSRLDCIFIFENVKDITLAKKKYPKWTDYPVYELEPIHILTSCKLNMDIIDYTRYVNKRDSGKGLDALIKSYWNGENILNIDTDYLRRDFNKGNPSFEDLSFEILFYGTLRVTKEL